MTMTFAGQVLRTVRHLRPVQVTSRLQTRFRRVPPPSAPGAIRPATAAWRLREPLSGQEGDRARLLHRQTNRHWEAPATPRLWRYHLHYFDNVADPGFAAQVLHWMEHNPPGRGTGWEPYPLSRRIPNWIAWLLAGQTPAPGMIESLAHQSQALTAQVEHHLQANHLLANWRALAFSACFFQTGQAAAAAARWTDELQRQLLDDGAHEERSPMYHALILADHLDLLELDRCYGGLTGAAGRWCEQAAVMLGWLSQMSHPDGRIAFFQDAAFDMAPAYETLRARAAALGVRPQVMPLGGSGYVRMAQDSTVLWMDAGSPGPAHQPGHAHACALSLELSHEGQRFLVNSGVSTYEPGPVRSFERSTAAHNTLRLNGRDQSEMWAAFRVGRRAQATLLHRGDRRAVAQHDGYAPIVHRREVRLSPHRLTVEDRLEGSGEHSVEIYFQLHPEITVEGELQCRHPRGPAIRLRASAPAAIEPTAWRPEFGLHVPNQTIVLRQRATLPAAFTTHIDLEP